MITSQPWYIDLTALAAGILGLVTIIKLIIWPGLKAIGKAIVAAPRIAEGVGRLVELLETDLLTRVETIETLQKHTLDRIDTSTAAISGHTARLDEHKIRLDTYENRVILLEGFMKIMQESLDKLSKD